MRRLRTWTAKQWLIAGLLVLSAAALLDQLAIVSISRPNSANRNPPKVVIDNVSRMVAHEKQAKIPQASGTPREVRVEGFRGRLLIETSPDGPLDGYYKVTARAGSEEEAAAAVENIVVRAREEEDSYVLAVEGLPPLPFRSGEGGEGSVLQKAALVAQIMTMSTVLELTLQVPDGVDLHIESAGTVEIDGIQGDVQVFGLGVVNVRNLGGSMGLELDGGAAELDGIEGGLTIRARRSAVEARHIRGDVAGELRFGAGEFRDIEGNIHVDVSGASLEISKVSGDVTVTGERANVTAGNVGGNVQVSGEITLRSE